MIRGLTGWLRRSQLRIIVAAQASIVVGNSFEWITWSVDQVVSVEAALVAWLGVAAGQSVDTRALDELDELPRI